MNTRTLLAGLIGGLAYWIMGFVMYVLLLANYFGQHHGSGLKDPYDMWAIVVGCILFGILLAYIFDRWANISTLKSGAIAGATLGLLAHLSFNFIRFGDSTFFTSLPPAILDSVVQTVMSAVGGAVAGLVLGKMKKE